ncbi:MAG: hypothetical protein CMC08_09030 [Flavobacteriaceae bacterium]|nr:hypothetical protein [Flavobacteriaceae bacterium]
MKSVSLTLYFLLLLFALAPPTEIKAQQAFIEELRHYELDAAKKAISTLPKSAYAMATWQVDFLIHFNISNPLFQSITTFPRPNDDGLGDFYYYINLGDYNFYNFGDKNIEALNHYRTALQLANGQDDDVLRCEALKKILTLHRIAYLYDNTTYLEYLEQYDAAAYDALERAYYNYYNLILNFKNHYVEAWDPSSFRTLNDFLGAHNTPYLKGISYTVYASYYEELKKRDSIWHYINEGENAFRSIPYNYKGSRLNQLLMFKARTIMNEDSLSARQKISMARAAIDSALSRSFNKTDDKIVSLSHYYGSVIDTLDNDYRNAFQKLILYNRTRDSIREYRYNDLLNELEVKFQTSEKERQLLVEKEQRKKTQYLALGLAGLLLFGSVIAVLLYRNTKRKQYIAEQQREIERQKAEKILKEQELTSIDAMIAGQEKERQRLAGDLHDSVGATLAAAKLQFSHLHALSTQEDNTTELFEKTGNLLDAAYTEIRNMAHLKNSGVFAKDSLLPAINKFAKNASSVQNLNIEVQDFGMEERLDNVLEIALFRIVQELVTNIIKHAQATEASISLTRHADHLNLMVEDNGIGFKLQTAFGNEGMGLSNIEKRIMHLEGTLEVDSSPENGTTIIIDIPI